VKNSRLTIISFSASNILLHCLLLCIISDGNFVNFVIFFVLFSCDFFCDFLFFFWSVMVLSSLIFMNFHLFSFMFLVVGICEFILFTKVRKCKAIISSNIVLDYFRDSNYIYMSFLEFVPLFIYSQTFFFVNFISACFYCYVFELTKSFFYKVQSAFNSI
jgi:hypothetical protein